MGTAQQLLIYGAATGGSFYTPVVAYALLGSDSSTSSTSYGTLLTTSVTVAGTSDCVTIVATAAGDVQSTGNTPAIQITVDGTSIAESACTEATAGGLFNITRVASVTGLSAGSHTVLLKWKSVNGNAVRIRPVANPSQNHAAIACRVVSGGGTTYLTSSTASTTNTTVSDSLLSGTFTSVLASSALYLRFSACGVHAGTARTARFRLLVDGVTVGGTADSGDGSGNAFNAGMVCVVPVTAGSHTVAVQWGGDTSGGATISGDPRQHAALVVDEVYATSPQYAGAAADFPSALSNTTLDSISFTAPTGGYSDVLIEGTFDSNYSAASGVGGQIKIDGSNVCGAASGTISNAGQSSTMLTHVATGLSAGAHTIILLGVTGGGVSPGTHPEYMHANLVVWAVHL